MKDVKSNLFPMSLDYLYVGMKVEDEIFNYNGKVVLLGKGSVLDENKIEKLKKFNSGENKIYVLPETRKHLIDKKVKLDANSQKIFEAETGYTNIRQKTDEMLLEVRFSNKISNEKVHSLQDDVINQLNTTNLVDIFNLINAPRPVEEYFQRHCVNVGLINGLMGKWLNYSKDDINELVLAGLMHDVGKTKIPQEILNAPRKLTPEEFELIKMHPVYSFELLSESGMFSNRVLNAARHHHEKIDQSGYPDGLPDFKISDFAKITSISDVYDAMVSSRSYKDSCNPLIVLTQFANNEFKGFDKKFLSAFIRKMPAQLVGKTVLMSGGEMGKIEYIMPNDILNPIVRIGKDIMQASETWSCVHIIVDESDDFTSDSDVLTLPT